tara:strand:- start:121 stop:366 length:246 start_codon:yes stop_codon:yes gene_type:complete
VEDVPHKALHQLIPEVLVVGVQIEMVLVIPQVQEFVDKVIQVVILNQTQDQTIMMPVEVEVVLVEQEPLELLEVLEQVEQV